VRVRGGLGAQGCAQGTHWSPVMNTTGLVDFCTALKCDPSAHCDANASIPHHPPNGYAIACMVVASPPPSGAQARAGAQGAPCGLPCTGGHSAGGSVSSASNRSRGRGGERGRGARTTNPRTKSYSSSTDELTAAPVE